jgi:two-component system alkaline phosphatase synthesis response regulator PhoP
MLVKKRILVIDDEPDICNFSKSALERTGKFEVLVATDALTGINLAKSNNPDLILLDVNMPDIDGGEVAQQLRDYKATSEIPIIFLTALLRKEEAGGDPGKIGRHFFIAKPVASKELIEKIESVLKINNS